MNSTLVGLSKAMSSILRHNAIKQGINISKDGWVKVSELLDHLNGKAKRGGYTLEDVNK